MSEQREMLKKLIAMQEKIMPALEEYEANGPDQLPADLRKAIENIKMWDAEVERQMGDDKGYREWPPKQFAHQLEKHITLFKDHTLKDRIREYNQMVGKLPYDFDRAHV